MAIKPSQRTWLLAWLLQILTTLGLADVAMRSSASLPSAMPPASAACQACVCCRALLCELSDLTCNPCRCRNGLTIQQGTTPALTTNGYNLQASIESLSASKLCCPEVLEGMQKCLFGFTRQNLLTASWHCRLSRQTHWIQVAVPFLETQHQARMRTLCNAGMRRLAMCPPPSSSPSQTHAPAQVPQPTTHSGAGRVSLLSSTLPCLLGLLYCVMVHGFGRGW